MDLEIPELNLEQLKNDVKALKVGPLIATERQDDYTISIYKGIKHSLRYPEQRSGQIIITNPEGIEVGCGFWMDFPERSWKIKLEDYHALPLKTRARMEAVQQTTYGLATTFKEHLDIYLQYGIDWEPSGS